MASFSTKRLLKYFIVGSAATGAYFTLKSNDFDLNPVAVVKLCRAAFTTLNIGVMYKTNLYKTGIDKTSQEYIDLKSECHQKAAEQLLSLCRKNRGVYIKVGQHIATLDYLLPKEYVETMKVLHSHAPTNKLEDILRAIKEELKTDPSELFSTIDPEPVGTASLAQVHKAILKDGSVVAIKVQHPDVKRNTKADLKTMEVLVKLASFAFPEFQIQWLVDETKKNIPRELDFLEEGRNSERVAGMFKNYDWLIIPKVWWDLSTSRILTMDYVEGGQVNDIKYIKEHKINPYEVTAKLGKLYSQMIFLNGFVHSDPHPGNILLRKSDRGDCDIILLDHGLYATLSKDFQVEYAHLWLSILNSDRAGMRKHCKNLGIEGNVYGILACMVSGHTWDSIMNGIEKKKQTKEEIEALQKLLPTVLTTITEILQNVNRQMLLILKTNDLIRGLEHTLGTSNRMGAFKTMSECCIKTVYTDKLDTSKSRIVKLKYLVAEKWYLFKLNVYYAALYLGSWYEGIMGSCIVKKL